LGLETLARDLRSVVGVGSGKPVILVGHSIGGMINLTFCRLFPAMPGREVAGIIQVDTTLYESGQELATLAIFHWDATAGLPRIKMPVLLLVGQQENDDVAVGQRIHARCDPQVQLAIVTPSLQALNKVLSLSLRSLTTVWGVI
jgi:pimeloyl-ACP methyl ester carboxylesterase